VFTTCECSKIYYITLIVSASYLHLRSQQKRTEKSCSDRCEAILKQGPRLFFGLWLVCDKSATCSKQVLSKIDVHFGHCDMSATFLKRQAHRLFAAVDQSTAS